MTAHLAIAWRLAILVAVLLVSGPVAFPSTWLNQPTNVQEDSPVVRGALPQVEPRVVDPAQDWPGLVVVDFRQACNYVYVLRLARTLERPVDLGLLLFSLREGIVLEELDAEVDFAGFLAPIAYPTAILTPLTDGQSVDFQAVFPGGHFDYVNGRGEGSALAGTFSPRGSREPGFVSYMIESRSASVLARGVDWFPLEVRFLLTQPGCD